MNTGPASRETLREIFFKVLLLLKNINMINSNSVVKQIKIFYTVKFNKSYLNILSRGLTEGLV